MRQSISAADIAQDEAARRKRVIGLQKDADSFAGMPSALPVIKSGMSNNEIAAAQQRINFLKGRTRSVSATTGAPKPAIGSPDGSAPATLPNEQRTAGGGAFRGSSQAEIKDFFDSDPINGTAAKAKAAEVAKAAGTGNQVQTPFGTVSSTDSRKGEAGGPAQPIYDASGTQTGVGRAGGMGTWQEQIAKKYPEIGKAGTPENIAFTKAYNGAITQGPNPSGTAGQMPVDPFAMADKTMKDVASARNAPKPVSITRTSLDPGVPMQPPATDLGKGISAQLPDQGARTQIGDKGISIPTPTTVTTPGASATSSSGDTIPRITTPGGVSIGGMPALGGTVSVPPPEKPINVPAKPSGSPDAYSGTATPAIGTASLPSGPKAPTPAMALPPMPSKTSPDDTGSSSPSLMPTTASADSFSSIPPLPKFAENPDENEFKKKLNYPTAA